MIRKIIQIAVAHPVGSGDPDMLALCNDGSLWTLNGHANWIEMPAIPQDESKDPITVLQSDVLDLHRKLREAEEKVNGAADIAGECLGKPSHIARTIGSRLHAVLGIDEV